LASWYVVNPAHRNNKSLRNGRQLTEKKEEERRLASWLSLGVFDMGYTCKGIDDY
jgi:hypothetical protein